MTKTNSFKITDKVLIWLAIPVVLLIAGLILFFVLGFNPDASIADSKSLVITHDAFVNSEEGMQDDLHELCAQEIKDAKLSFIDYAVSQNEMGGKIEYTFAPETENATLIALGDDIISALGENNTLKFGIYSRTVSTNVVNYAYDYIWRAAISVGVALVIAFVYIAVRYRFSMGLAALICGIADLAVMLSLTCILRIPVTTALATAAVFAVLYSVLVSTVSFNRMRNLFKTEEYQAMPVTEAMEQAASQTYKRIALLGICAVVFFVLLAIFGGAAVRAFALPVILGVLASTFSGVCLAPSLVTVFKVQGQNMKAASEEKVRLANKQAEEERAKKRSAKKD